MTAINRLTQKTTLVDADLFPIWDSESSRTRAITVETLKGFIDDEFSGKHIESGALTDGTLTLTYTDGSTIDIPGFVVKSTDLIDMPQNLESGKILKVNGAGDGYVLASEPSIVGGNGYINKGTIDQTGDPKLLDTGAYYVTEAFIDPPALTGSYVGFIIIQDDIDGNNGRLLSYYTQEGIFYRQKLAGGWEAWSTSHESAGYVKLPDGVVIDD
ncbi:MAG: hypothetical protein ACPH3C_08075, partial [Glaciecola sp.]